MTALCGSLETGLATPCLFFSISFSFFPTLGQKDYHFYIFYLLLLDFTLSVTPSLPVNFRVKPLTKTMIHSPLKFVHQKLNQVYNFYQVICCPVVNVSFSKIVWRAQSVCVCESVLVFKVFTDFFDILKGLYD